MSSSAKVVGKAATADKVQIIGFYFALKDKMSTLEPLLAEFFADLIRQMNLLGRLTITLDGTEQVLTEELMQKVIKGESKQPPVSEQHQSGGVSRDDFRLFKGGYIRLFEDGSAFQKIMYRIFECLGEAKIWWIRWKTQFRMQNKSNPKLRAFYRFMDDSFISQLPVVPYSSFAVDTLLYCEWRCNHPNMIGFHLVMLTWMLDIPEFKRFVPDFIKAATPIVDPLLKLFWPLSGLKIQLTTSVAAKPVKKVLANNNKQGVSAQRLKQPQEFSGRP